MSILRRRTFEAAQGPTFDPNTLTPDYFNATQYSFNGTSDYIDTGITNYPFDFSKQYFEAWIKFAPLDGNPTTIQTLFGAFTSTAAHTQLILLTDGKIRFRARLTNFDSSAAHFTNGVNSYKTIRISGHKNISLELYVDGTLIEDLGAVSTMGTTVVNIYYGCHNNSGTPSGYFSGNTKAIFIKGDTTNPPLSSEDITNLNTYFNLI